MKIFKNILVLLVVMATNIVMAQNDKLTLKDCINFALTNNASNVIFKNQVEIAELQKIEALSGYMPQINASGTFDDNIKRPVTVIPAGAFSPTDLKVQFGNQYNTSAIVQVDQVIFDKSLLTGMKANKPNNDVAQLKKLKNDDDLIYSTVTSYYQALSYKEHLKLLSENEKKLSNLLIVQKLLLEKGVISKVNYTRVQVNYNNVISQKKIAEMNYYLSLTKLKNAMGYSVEKEINIVDSINYTPDIQMPDDSKLSINNRPDYQILEKNLVLQEIDLKRKRASVLPTLSAYARYGASSFNNDFSKAYSKWYDFSSVGLRANIPLFGGLKRYSQIKQGELNLSNSKQNLFLNAESIKLQVQSANTQLLSSYENLQLNKNNIELAKTVFEETSLQYEKGVVTLTDFLNADYAYKEAQTNYINSLLTYLTVKIDLERSKGTIKQFVNQL